VLFNKTTLKIVSIHQRPHHAVSIYHVHYIDAAHGPITRFWTTNYDVFFLK